MQGITIRIVTITPELSKEWLTPGVNHSNRDIKPVRVSQYADNLSSGRFIFNGDTIKFSRSGRLLDGQHRLEACVRTGIPFVSVVVWGLEEEAFATIDTNCVRDVKTVLRMSGEKNSSALTTVLNILNAYETGTIKRAEKLTSQQALEVKERHPKLAEVVSLAASFPTKIKSGALAFTWYVGRLFDPAATDAFMAQLKTGESLRRGDPALTLRNLLLNGGIPDRGAYRSAVGTAMYIKSLNAYLEDKQVHRLRYTPTTDEFPSIYGFPYGQTIHPTRWQKRVA